MQLAPPNACAAEPRPTSQDRKGRRKRATRFFGYARDRRQTRSNRAQIGLSCEAARESSHCFRGDLYVRVEDKDRISVRRQGCAEVDTCGESPIFVLNEEDVAKISNDLPRGLGAFIVDDDDPRNKGYLLERCDAPAELLPAPMMDDYGGDPHDRESSVFERTPTRYGFKPANGPRIHRPRCAPYAEPLISLTRDVPNGAHAHAIALLEESSYVAG